MQNIFKVYVCSSFYEGFALTTLLSEMGIKCSYVGMDEFDELYSASAHDVILFGGSSMVLLGWYSYLLKIRKLADVIRSNIVVLTPDNISTSVNVHQRILLIKGKITTQKMQESLRSIMFKKKSNQLPFDWEPIPPHIKEILLTMLYRGSLLQQAELINLPIDIYYRIRLYIINKFGYKNRRFFLLSFIKCETCHYSFSDIIESLLVPQVLISDFNKHLIKGDSLISWLIK